MQTPKVKKEYGNKLMDIQNLLITRIKEDSDKKVDDIENKKRNLAFTNQRLLREAKQIQDEIDALDLESTGLINTKINNVIPKLGYVISEFQPEYYNKVLKKLSTIKDYYVLAVTNIYHNSVFDLDNNMFQECLSFTGLVIFINSEKTTKKTFINFRNSFANLTPEEVIAEITTNSGYTSRITNNYNKLKFVIDNRVYKNIITEKIKLSRLDIDNVIDSVGTENISIPENNFILDVTLFPNSDEFTSKYANVTNLLSFVSTSDFYKYIVSSKISDSYAIIIDYYSVESGYLICFNNDFEDFFIKEEDGIEYLFYNIKDIVYAKFKVIKKLKSVEPYTKLDKVIIKGFNSYIVEKISLQ